MRDRALCENRVLLFVKVPIVTEKRNQVSISDARDHWRQECRHQLVPLKRPANVDPNRITIRLPDGQRFAWSIVRIFTNSKHCCPFVCRSLSSDNSPQPPSPLLHITITAPSSSSSPLRRRVSLFFLAHLFVGLLALQPLLLPLILTTPSHLPGRATTQVRSM